MEAEYFCGKVPAGALFFCVGGLGTGDADCHSQCAHWLRNDMVFTRGQCKAGRRGGGTPPYGWVTRSAVGRADVGSELSAASGRSSEVSEWPRSKFPASAVRQRRNFGHRNRVIGPYERSQEVQWLLGGAM